jgi:hypothetical protein
VAKRLDPKPKRPAPVGVGHPAIPFEFDPPGNDFEAGHLTEQTVEGGERITWPLIGKSVFAPDRKGKPAAEVFFIDLETIAQDNPQLTIHALGGFSLGDYHELFIGGAPAHRAYRFGAVEASFGEGSPLLARLFWNVYYEKYWGEWSSCTSLRITNCPPDLVERYVIAALLEYRNEIGLLLSVMQVDFNGLDFDEEFDAEPTGQGIVAAAPPVTDLDPLRFYISGLSSDDEAACLAFYRVLEFYAFMQQAAQVTALRRDVGVSDAEFTRRTLELASRDEKGPIFKLLGQITTSDVLKAAKAGGLITEARQDRFNDALYAYRNAIVHGKFGAAFTLRSQSVLLPNGESGRWRALLQDLAWAALQNLGTKG